MFMNNVGEWDDEEEREYLSKKEAA